MRLCCCCLFQLFSFISNLFTHCISWWTSVALATVMDAAVRPLMSHSTLCVIIAIKLDQIGLRGAMIVMSLLNMVNVY